MYMYSALSFEVVMSCIQIIYNLNYHFEMLYNVFNIICNRIAVVKTILFMRTISWNSFTLIHKTYIGTATIELQYCG